MQHGVGRLPLVMAWICIATTSAVAASRAQETAPSPLNQLVREGDASDRISLDEGTLRMSAGPGWVRTRRIYSNFVLTTQFRLETAETEAGVGIRAVSIKGEWPHRGYRLRISGSQPVALDPRDYKMSTLKHIAAHTLRVGEWHNLTLTAIGRSVTIAIDQTIIGVYEIESRAGSVLFETQHGSAEFRQLAFRQLPEPGVVRGQNYKGRPEAVSPKLKHEVKPSYTNGSMGRRVEGAVLLEATVLTDGSVGGVDLVTLLDPELEHAALDAIRQWKFEPGTLHGTPVDFKVGIEMSFTLRGRPRR